MTSYNIFTKHAEKMLKKVKVSRPVLKGAYHQTDGSVVATDSHRLYKLHNGYQTTEPFIQNLTTGNMIDGNYPDTSRLIPDMSEALHTIQLNVKDTLNAAKAMFTAHKAINPQNRHSFLQIINQDDVWNLIAGTETSPFQASYKLEEIPSHGSDVNISFQGQFLVDALALFKDAGETEINLRYYGNMRPFVLESKDVEVLIMPVKVY